MSSCADVAQQITHFRPLEIVRHLHREVSLVTRFQQPHVAAGRGPYVLHLEQGPRLLDQVVARAIHLAVRNVEAPYHHARFARPVLDLLQCLRVWQAAIDRMSNGFPPNARGFRPVLGLDLGACVLEHAEEVDPPWR